MRRIIKVYKAYLEADNNFMKREANARKTHTRQFWSDQRALNDQAYFVMLFAKLEARINDQCTNLIFKKQSASNWKTRRWWDDIDLSRLEKIPFMQRVGLLVYKGSHHHRDIKDIYEIRCKLAHGSSYSAINIPSLASKMYNLARILNP